MFTGDRRKRVSGGQLDAVALELVGGIRRVARGWSRAEQLQTGNHQQVGFERVDEDRTELVHDLLGDRRLERYLGLVTGEMIDLVGKTFEILLGWRAQHLRQR